MSRPHPPSHRPTDPPALDRRALLRGGAGLGALALGAAAMSACGESRSPTSEAGAGATPTNALIAAFPQSTPLVAVGAPTRLPYLIADGEGVPLTRIDGPVTFTIRRDGEKVGGPVEVAPRSEGVPRAYLPLQFTFPEAVIYDVEAEYRGQRLDSQLQVYDRARVGAPVVGDRLPPADTATFTQPLGVDPVCSRAPVCPFHGVNLREVVGTGRPLVVMLSTPAFCQTAICGPVLDELVVEAGNRPGLTVVHSEVYKNPKEVRDLADATLAPLPSEYKLDFEPTMFVVDSGGTIVARADVIVSADEMRELLDLVS